MYLRARAVIFSWIQQAPAPRHIWVLCMSRRFKILNFVKRPLLSSRVMSKPGSGTRSSINWDTWSKAGATSISWQVTWTQRGVWLHGVRLNQKCLWCTASFCAFLVQSSKAWCAWHSTFLPWKYGTNVGRWLNRFWMTLIRPSPSKNTSQGPPYLMSISHWALCLPRCWRHTWPGHPKADMRMVGLHHFTVPLIGCAASGPGLSVSLSRRLLSVLVQSLLWRFMRKCARRNCSERKWYYSCYTCLTTELSSCQQEPRNAMSQLTELEPHGRPTHSWPFFLLVSCNWHIGIPCFIIFINWFFYWFCWFLFWCSAYTSKVEGDAHATAASRSKDRSIGQAWSWSLEISEALIQTLAALAASVTTIEQ